MALRVGDPAPDFTLDGVDGRSGEAGTYTLSDLRGEVVVLVFYPADNTPVCTQQLQEYTAGIGRFDAVGSTVWAISPQGADSHRAFADAQGGFAFPLLSDVDLAVGGAYGILGLRDLYRRSTFVVDASGYIAYAHRFVGLALGFKPVEELVAAVSAAAST